VKYIDYNERTLPDSHEKLSNRGLQEELDKMKQDRDRLQGENERLRKVLHLHIKRSKIFCVSMSKAEEQARSAAHIVRQLKKALDHDYRTA
jgi:hypothetical protein